MKKLISDTDGYKVFVEVIYPSSNIEKIAVIFYTRWQNAKNPEEYQKKFEMFLTENELANLINLIEGLPMPQARLTYLKNNLTNEEWICDDISKIKEIDGVIFIEVHKEHNQRRFWMRKDSLVKTKNNLTKIV